MMINSKLTASEFENLTTEQLLEKAIKGNLNPKDAYVIAKILDKRCPKLKEILVA
jgi:hypothetical protein